MNLKILKADYILPVSSSLIQKGFILIENNQIKTIGKQTELPCDFNGQVIEFKNGVILPGFINLHSHIEYTMVPTSDGSLSFFPWIKNLIETCKDWTLEDFLVSAKKGADLSLESGITCIADTTPIMTSLIACKEKGVRGVIYQEVFGWEQDERLILNELEQKLQEAEEKKNDILKIGISLHAPYTVSPSVWKAVMNFAEKHGYPLHCHVAESLDEKEWFLTGKGVIAGFRENWDPPGISPVHFFAKTDCLSNQMICAHCVQVDEEDLKILKERQIIIAHCPRSNLLLKNGVMPLSAIIKHNVKWGIGTDSLASCQTLDLFDEMRAVIKLHPDIKINSFDLIKKVTYEHAQYLGMNSIGSLEADKKADLIIVNLQNKTTLDLKTNEKLCDILLECSAKDVIFTMINGKICYEFHE